MKLLAKLVLTAACGAFSVAANAAGPLVDVDWVKANRLKQTSCARTYQALYTPIISKTVGVPKILQAPPAC